MLRSVIDRYFSTYCFRSSWLHSLKCTLIQLAIIISVWTTLQHIVPKCHNNTAVYAKSSFHNCIPQMNLILKRVSFITINILTNTWHSKTHKTSLANKTGPIQVHLWNWNLKYTCMDKHVLCASLLHACMRMFMCKNLKP